MANLSRRFLVMYETDTNPVPNSAYEASRIYICALSIPTLIIGCVMSRFKPWSERYPVISLSGLGSLAILLFCQSVESICGWHVVWRQFMAPVCFLPIILQALRYNYKCAFQEVIDHPHSQSRLDKLLALKHAASYKRMFLLLGVGVFPQISVIALIAATTNDFKSMEIGYRAYGDSGFCVVRTWENGMIATMGFVYGYVGLKLSRSLRGRKDEYHVGNNLLLQFRYGGFAFGVNVIIVVVEKYITFYYIRGAVLFYIMMVVLVQSWEVWMAMLATRRPRRTVDARMGLKELLSFEEGFEAFSKQLAREFSKENLAFWKDVVELEDSIAAGNVSDVRASVEKLYNLYVSPSAPLQVCLLCSRTTIN